MSLRKSRLSAIIEEGRARTNKKPGSRRAFYDAHLLRAGAAYRFPTVYQTARMKPPVAGTTGGLKLVRA
jgi:hypothetical protein